MGGVQVCVCLSACVFVCMYVSLMALCVLKVVMFGCKYLQGGRSVDMIWLLCLDVNTYRVVDL